MFPLLPSLYLVLTVRRDKIRSCLRIGWVENATKGGDGHRHGARPFAMRQNSNGVFGIKEK